MRNDILHNNYFIHSAAATPFLSAAFGQGDGPIAVGDVVCSGTEPQLTNCTFELTHNCISHSNDVGVRCVPSTSGIVETFEIKAFIQKLDYFNLDSDLD